MNQNSKSGGTNKYPVRVALMRSLRQRDHARVPLAIGYSACGNALLTPSVNMSVHITPLPPHTDTQIEKERFSDSDAWEW